LGRFRNQLRRVGADAWGTRSAGGELLAPPQCRIAGRLNVLITAGPPGALDPCAISPIELGKWLCRAEPLERRAMSRVVSGPYNGSRPASPASMSRRTRHVWASTATSPKRTSSSPLPRRRFPAGDVASRRSRNRVSVKLDLEPPDIVKSSPRWPSALRRGFARKPTTSRQCAQQAQARSSHDCGDHVGDGLHSIAIQRPDVLWPGARRRRTGPKLDVAPHSSRSSPNACAPDGTRPGTQRRPHPPTRVRAFDAAPALTGVRHRSGIIDEKSSRILTAHRSRFPLQHATRVRRHGSSRLHRWPLVLGGPPIDSNRLSIYVEDPESQRAAATLRSRQDGIVLGNLVVSSIRYQGR